jgi:hypothetical protein
MATKATTEPIRFIVDVAPDQYDATRLLATVYPVYLEDDKIRNCSWSYLGDRGADYADLRVQGWLDKAGGWTDFHYGIAHEPLEYREVFSLDLNRAMSMVKTLRRLTKKIDSLKTRYGDPQDFAGYLHYLALAFGNTAPGGAIFARKVSGRNWTYDDNEYLWMDSTALRYYFQQKIREFKGEE